MSRLAGVGAALLRSRRFTRAPIWLYRLRLGALLGPRLLLLEHRGRSSGLARHVVLEVIGHPSPRRYVVASGFGERAQWFRNVRADPRVRVTIGSHAPAPATARVLDQREADRALGDYIAAHPGTWDRFKSVLEQTLGAEVTEVDTPLPMVELALDDPATRS
ncbi:nitroreductase [Mycolicibacillus trivialis]|uniref:Nitroreductase n=1 Tax=Mycolicibacillus trivialis TaxID=1798 RepID=A0A1X2EPG6_9MYCO|nr:nitroreductase [Mycolicibacillus trivialis]